MTTARERALDAIQGLSADATAEDIQAAVKAAILPREPDYLGAVVRIIHDDGSRVFARVDDSYTGWLSWRATGMSTWADVCAYGMPVELVPITELDRAQREYRDAKARFASLHAKVTAWAKNDEALDALYAILEAAPNA